MARITNTNTKEINGLTTNVAVILNKVEYIEKEVGDIKIGVDCMVKDDESYKSLKIKVNTLWDERNKLIGWLFGAGVVGGTTGALIKQLVTGVFAK